jgi:hypothetical protein
VLPEGWKEATVSCVPKDRTVVTGNAAIHCPAMFQRPPPVSVVSIGPLYGRQFALTWPGSPGEWSGQPAWRSESTTDRVTTATLALPWENALVTARSPDAALARSLLQQVKASAAGGLEVPSQASSVFVQSLAGRESDGLARNATVTNPSDVRRLLADLSGLKHLTGSKACDGEWWPKTILLTVSAPQSSRTYAARYGQCGQVIAGTGSAASASPQLLADIRRLVPASGQ